MSKNPTSQNDFMTAVQFPLKLAFACTAHKMQGSTVTKPDSLAIDLTSVREAATAYVMMSRVQALLQLFILDIFLSCKLYPSPSAMEELKRLQQIAKNEDEKKRKESSLLSTINARSLTLHHKNLIKDPMICGQVIAVQETWCDPQQENLHLQLPGYEMLLVSQGRGKGIATFYRNNFKENGFINTPQYQISRVSNQKVNIINVYLSKGADKRAFLRDLGSLARGAKKSVIVGDFNIDYLKSPEDIVIKTILSCGFKQIVSSPTHEKGGLINHIYIKNITSPVDVAMYFPFYTDHAALSIVIHDL